MERKPYPSDLSDAEWAFVAPYLTLMTEDAPQRDHSWREHIPPDLVVDRWAHMVRAAQPVISR